MVPVVLFGKMCCPTNWREHEQHIYDAVSGHILQALDMIEDES